LYRIASKVCDLPGQIDGETGFHHLMAYGEAAGMIDSGHCGRIYVDQVEIEAGNILHICSILISFPAVRVPRRALFGRIDSWAITLGTVPLQIDIGGQHGKPSI